jgi:hypothetical protein
MRSGEMLDETTNSSHVSPFSQGVLMLSGDLIWLFPWLKLAFINGVCVASAEQ